MNKEEGEFFHVWDEKYTTGHVRSHDKVIFVNFKESSTIRGAAFWGSEFFISDTFGVLISQDDWEKEVKPELDRIYETIKSLLGYDTVIDDNEIVSDKSIIISDSIIIEDVD